MSEEAAGEPAAKLDAKAVAPDATPDATPDAMSAKPAPFAGVTDTGATDAAPPAPMPFVLDNVKVKCDCTMAKVSWAHL